MRLAVGLLGFAVAVSWCDVRLPALISDHMLLQREVPVRIWGWAEPGESVTVAFRGQTATAVTGSLGKWQVWLSPVDAGAAAEMTVSGKNTLTVRDVLLGEVWVGSGQSNMVWPISRSNNPQQEAASANYPQIRLFKMALKTSPEPLEDVEGKWETCSPETVKEFSAVGYFFARHLHKKLNVPFGVIQSAWGGTPAQAWTSRKALYADAALLPILADWNRVLDAYPDASQRYQQQVVEWEARRKQGGDAPRRPVAPMGPGHSHTPTGLYNAMIEPLIPYAIRGVIWYQGESNASRTQAKLYQRLFETMIRDWREQWGIGDFPFLFVQLANFAKAGSPADWVVVQEAQARTLGLRQTGMAVINDIGDPVDIHPTNKQDVGERLALAARHLAYKEQLVYSGPRFRQATREGAKLRVWFDSVGGGLKAKGEALKGFEVAGADRRWYPAEAKIEGKTVVASSASVTQPEAVRYAWASNPECNLRNAEGLPASVFRSVDW
ncbi:MAG: sialate O-acetylesterase [Acidimicrobiia bacterium]|nr:sialate O-acetylesterase [Acidimicrobiia bacterium]